MIRLVALNRNSVRTSLLKTGKRAALSIPFQLGCYWLFVLNWPEFNSDPQYWYWGALLLTSSISRLSLWRFGEFILDRGNGQFYFRALLAYALCSAGWGWGFSYYHALMTIGNSIHTFLILVACCAIAQVSASSFSFDLFATFTSQILLVAPIGVSLLLRPDVPGSFGMGIGSFIYLIYVMAQAMSVRKTQVQLLLSYEDLEKKDKDLREVHHELTEQHHLVHAMHESIDEGFLLFGPDGVCRTKVSRTAVTLLGVDPQNRTLSEALGLNGAAKIKLENWYQILFADQLDFTTVAGNGPSLLDLDQGRKTIKIKFHPLRDEKGLLQGVIMTAADTTAEIEAIKAASEERERAQMILRIHDNRAGFHPVLEEFEKLIDDLFVAEVEDIDRIGRELHNLKGAAMMYGIGTLSRMVYTLEIKLKESPEEERLSRIRGEAPGFRDAFLSWRNRELELLTGLGVFEGDSVEVSRRKLQALGKRFSGDPNLAAAYKVIAEELCSLEFGDLIREFEEHVVTVAGRLGKMIDFDVAPVDSPLQIPQGALREPIRSLVHLLNNSIDHGIESPEGRILNGKGERGRITVRYKKDSQAGRDFVTILIEDDGGGINLGKVRDILRKKHANDEAEKSDLEVAMHIFDRGLSTRDTVTEISGQGIGMGSVKASIQKARGRIRILRTDMNGTLFEVLLPLPASEGSVLNRELFAS